GQRVLGFNEPFFHQVFDAVLANMGEFYPGLAEQAPMIRETLVMEEQLFRRTLHRGVEMLNSQITELQTKGISVYSGDAAFLLYDTFGFPLEVTQEICAEEGLTVDIESYEAAMATAQERSRGASGMDNVYGGVSANFDFENQESGTPTQFVGYEFGAAEVLIVGALPELNDQGLCTGRVAIALNTTPFYAESGGQVADLGVIIGQEFELGVVEVVKQNGIYIHLAELTKVNHPEPIAGKNAEDALAILHFQLFDKPCIAQVDLLYRSHVQRNHTATHLLHAALRNTLGKHVTQAGSLVEPRHLRFDFTHSKAISVDELATIEAIVNQEILINTPVVTFADLPIDEARARGAMALFGEKYGNRVRMVEIGDFSRELCGGIHVGSTGEIGLFKIIHEGSAASGVRRIEAVTGVGAYNWLNEQLGILREAASALKTTPKEVGSAVLRLQDQLRDERKKRERLAQQGATGEGTSIAVGGLELVVQKLDGAETKDATLVADKMVDGNPLRVAVIAAISEGKLSFVCKVGADALAKGAHAGNILREVAKVAGGGGGGRAEFATAGGKDIEKADEALAAAGSALAGMLK
ncbi:MAG: alanine--tRNA ligase, partial [Armatimonadetes bacterium]|nr:alanine--tRNA ligase [Armatimonadota bacterium]